MSSIEANPSLPNGGGHMEAFKRPSYDTALPAQTPPRRTYSDDLSIKSGDEAQGAKSENPDLVTETPTKNFLNLNPNIDDQSPAAEALRANAGVHVRRTTKLARKIHANAVRKIVKNATRVGMGNRRGKPPRIPPNRENSEESGIYMVEEEDVDGSESDDDDEVEEYASSQKYSEDNTVDFNRKVAGMIEDANKIPAEILNGTIETGKKLLAFADPHDIIQTNRWRRRRKRGVDKNRKSYVKGKVIDGEHELYTLSIAVMMGVRNSIGNTNTHLSAEKKRWLTSDDFMATEKYIFKPSGSARTPPHQLGHTFKFKDYSPTAFAYMRRLFGINEFDFLVSVCGNANFIEFISNAKSGQFFFYSSDGKFMIKTMTNAESKFLRRILPHYFRHCCTNPNTVLTKFLGMYRVKLYHLRRNVKFVIMNSVYYTDKYLQSFYDLKGSVTGRQAKPGQDVKKDNDLRNNLPESAIALNPAQRVRLRKQIVADCEFMTRMKIMDYSMLIGIHHIPQKGKGLKSDKNVGTTGFRFSDARKESLKFRELLRTSLRDTSTIGHQSMPNRILHENDGEHIRIKKYGSVPSNITGLSFDSDDKGIVRPGSPARSSKSTRSIGSVSPMARHLQRSSSDLGSADSSRDGDYMKDSEKRFAHLAMYEYGLDDDDDNSYLEGTANNPVVTAPPLTASTRANSLELKKAQTIEKVYWPFHRLYDIHGLRRMTPGICAECFSDDCKCSQSNDGSIIVPFVPPIFERKDAGYMMNTTGFEMPIKYCPANGKEFLCDGKIFYMGIIDILQQYNTRKRFEAKYRRVLGSGWRDASCVRPEIYAERFIEFFDQYSQRDASQEIHVNEGEEAIVFSKDDVKHIAKQEETKEEIGVD